MGRLVTFALGIYHVYFILYSTIWDIKHPNYQTWAGRWKTLTFITCMINCWYFIASFLHEFLLTLLLPECITKKVRCFLDKVFGSVVCPAALLVVCAFWPIYLYAPNMIWSARYSEACGPVYGHMMHSLLAVMALVEVVNYNHKYPSFFKGLVMCSAFAVFYVCWLYYQRAFIGVWPYAILHKFSENQRMVFVGGVVGLLGVLYTLQYILHHVVHPTKSTADSTTTAASKTKSRKAE